MLDFKKSLLNNLNDKVFYRKYPETTPIATIPDKNSNDLVEVNEKELKKLEMLETTIRNENLRLYKKSQYKYMRMRFMLIIMPIILLIGTIFGFCLIPSKIKRKSNFNKYNVEKTYIDTNKGLKKEYSEVYGSNLSFIYDKFTDKKILLGTLKDSIEIKIKDDVDYISSSLHIEKNDKLSVDDLKSESGTFIDIKEDNDEKYENIDENYLKLIDDVINSIQKYNTTN